MEESSFWSGLEFRLCAEIKGLPESELRNYWCDGLEPVRYILDGPLPQIIGRAWMMTIAQPKTTPMIGELPPPTKRTLRQQEKAALSRSSKSEPTWEFTLFLPRPFATREEIEWDRLFPPYNVTRWLAADVNAKKLQFEPAAATPDLP
jgi:hypothetical protein